MTHFYGNTERGRRLPIEADVPFHLQVSRNLVHKTRNIEVFGRNDAVSTTEQPIWEHTGAHTFPAAAAPVSITSTSTDDAAGGLGARTVFLHGLDDNYSIISEEVTLSGTTAVTSTKSFLRLNVVHAEQAGDTGYNVGNITGTIGGDPQFRITATDGVAHQAIFTIPSGTTGYLESMEFTTGRDKEFDVALYYKLPGKSRLRASHTSLYQSATKLEFNYAVVFPETADVWLAATDGSSTNTVTGRMNLITVDEVLYFYDSDLLPQTEE